MSARPALPLIGAALKLDGLIQHRAWILERQRDLEIQDFDPPEVMTSDWRPLAEAIRRELDGYAGRLGLHGPFWGFTLDSKDPDVRAIANRRLHVGLDIAAALGADQMVIHSPFTTWDHHNLDNRPGARDEQFERFHATVGDVVKRAEAMGLVLVVENIEDKDPAARVDLVRSFGSPALRVSIDTGHANYAHGSTGAPPVDYYVHAAGNLLHHVHVQDTDGYADRHWPPGEGDVPWEAVFRALARLESRPRLVLELDDAADLRKGADYLIGLGLCE